MSNSIPSIIFSSAQAPVASNRNFNNVQPALCSNTPLPFASVIAKQVKNPLTNISLSVGLLESEITEYTQKIYLDIIKRSYLRIDNLMNLLLKNLSVNEAPVKECCLQTLLDEILALNAGSIILNKISVRKDYAISGFKIVTNEDKMRVALSNIVKNAIEAMTFQTGELEIVTKSIGKKYIVVIKDNGRGISKANLPYIFTPHYTTKQDGLGLGLALSYDTLRSNNVDISVASEEGKGTKFILCFNKN